MTLAVARRLEQPRALVLPGEQIVGQPDLAEAYLATQNVDAAREEITRALALDPSSAEAQALRAKIGQK